MMEYCPFDEDLVLCDPSGPSGKVVTVKAVSYTHLDVYKRQLYTHKDHFWYNDLEETFEDPYGGTGREGFKYQFDAVSKYVTEGRTEAEEVPLQYSLDLAYTMEQIRKTLKMI